MMQGLIDALQGDLGGALAMLGVPVLIWGIVQIALGVMSAHHEYKIKGILLFAAGALLTSLKAVISAIF